MKIILAAAIASSLISATLTAAEPIKVLIVDGQNNHDFERTTPYLKQVLEETGRFQVFVVTTPPQNGSEAAWRGFRPQFSDYDVVLSNYNGQTWPEDVRNAFEQFVKEGGGVVNVHAANNPFSDWAAFNDMIGLAWRPADFGDRVTLSEDGEVVRTEKGEGPGAGHGSQHPYTVVTRDRKHPVMEGLPAEWMHPQDELYHGQRGPAADMHILATAWSDPETGGTGEHEPMVWWIPHGEGKVFTTVLGHVGRGQPQETWPMRCRGFQAIVTRACEWVATGEVTIPLPDELPTAEEVSLAP
ncbi:MAG: ThuA domain-containing protein [Planctomycetota bacterium]|nr:MAG: ThuA domain-containing protein [Planctomycetota bacterium]REK25048.1 MAG: ThuA domain-containing protein [Planctomycetota bacterium]REK28113.1 MAG: ThuA domain-containing protein [Planctomycetota bacterium]